MSRPLLGILLFMLFMLMIVIVSRMIHTEYVVHTDGFMEIRKGRFTEDRRIELADIKQIDKMRKDNTLIIVMNNGEEYYLVPPKNEEDFIRCIEKYRV